MSQAVADNEAFVTLLHVAREDADVRQQLVAVLDLEPFHRRSALNTFVERMRLLGAPAEFIRAVACLTDDAIASRARELLNGLDD